MATKNVTSGPVDANQLVSAAAQQLKAANVRSATGRSSAVPSVRDIRYYQSLGLLDHAIRIGGRATYTSAHVERLYQIKKLQSEGHTLAQIRTLLGGGSDFWLTEPAGNEPVQRSVDDALVETMFSTHISPTVWLSTTDGTLAGSAQWKKAVAEIGAILAQTQDAPTGNAGGLDVKGSKK